LGIITFQWDAVSGDTVKLNGFVQPSVKGTAYNHGVDDEVTPGWELSAPQIQVRTADGGYITRYYADDMWDDDNSETVEGWGTADGVYDATTTLALGGGAWVKSPSVDASFTTAGAVASEETAVGGDTTIMILAGGAFPVSFKLNDTDAVTWTLTPGTAYNHGADDEVTPNWEKSAPQIQVRTADGGYITRYYADDMWDDDNSETVAGWGTADGVYDATTTVGVGGGFWLKQPNGDKKIYVTVKNPVK
jgi:hypothetical protein